MKPTHILLTSALLAPAFANLQALDLSSPQGTSVWTCVQSQGFTKAIPRLYQEACGSGGRIDPNFLQSYTEILDSGITNIDGYFYPCTGSTHACKPPSTQVSEIVSFLSANTINVTRLWFDLEPPNADSACQGWDYGASQNAALAREFVTAIKDTGLQWGVYANGNQWTSLFESRETDVASELPLWAVQWDGDDTLESTDTFMGGWTEAFAKQYGASTGGCAGAGAFDLNVFKE